MIFHKQVLISALFIFSKAELATSQTPATKSTNKQDEKQLPTFPYLPTSPHSHRNTQSSTDPNSLNSCGSCCYTIEPASAYSDKLDVSFYSKVINSGGFLIASSSSASDAALYEAALTYDKLTRGRPDLESTFVSEGAHLTVIGKDEDLTDVPEYKTYGSFWNRFRALGATSQRPVTSCSEENLLCLDGDVYSGENICVHANAHMILGDFLPTSRSVERFGSEDLEQALRNAYENSITNKELWENTYAGTNHREYFAEGLQSFFDVNAEGVSDGDGIHNTINTRSELETYDEDLYNIIERAFSTEYAFECPQQQACDCSSFECPHVEAPSSAPSFHPSSRPTLSVAPSSYPSIQPSSSPSMVPHRNVALLKPTSQSVTSHGGVSSRAVDGNINGGWHDGSVTHTGGEKGSWWKVDLEGQFEISEIKIYNRDDCCSDRLADFIVTVYYEDAVVWTYQNPSGTPPYENIIVTDYLEGDHVMISLPENDNSPLSLAEVIVMGRECQDCTQVPSAFPSLSPAPTVTAPKNVALLKPTSQSVTSHNGVSSRAVDGNTDGWWSHGSVTHTGGETGSWWKVNLEASYEIYQIKIYNRQDCCSGRLAGFIVTIYNQEEEVWTYVNPPGTPPYETVIQVDNALGDKVMVSLPENDNSPLQLAEVEVMSITN